MRKPTANKIAEKKAIVSTEGSGKGIGRGNNPNSRKGVANLKPHRYPKGTSGNPGGKPGYDRAAKIARIIFEQNEEAIYLGMAQRLIDGSAYDFSVLADRAFGKIKETHEVSVTPLDITVRFVKPNGKLKDLK